jgi:outer membrane lipoprotein-sorting protein
MNLSLYLTRRTLCGLLAFGFLSGLTNAQAQDAKALAAQLSANVNDGSSFVKLRMTVNGASGKSSLNVWLKARRSAAASDIIYQVIFPKERKGEAFLLSKSGSGAATGSVIVPPGAATALSAAKLKEGVFGSDISYEDIIDNFFAWGSQAIVGVEAVGRVECQILESKPAGARSSYGAVRSWIDVKKMVPMRIEKYSTGGQLALRIETKDTHKDDLGKWVTKSLLISRAGAGSTTQIEGTEIKHGVNYSDADFTAEGMQKLVVPSSK